MHLLPKSEGKDKITVMFLNNIFFSELNNILEDFGRTMKVTTSVNLC